MSETFTCLERSLDYIFNNKTLLLTALTHRSVGQDNNERLEYLGDALLGLIIAEAVYKQFPDASEGELTRLRASLVKGETLATLARKLELGQYLKLGGGELKSVIPFWQIPLRPSLVQSIWMWDWIYVAKKYYRCIKSYSITYHRIN